MACKDRRGDRAEVSVTAASIELTAPIAPPSCGAEILVLRDARSHAPASPRRDERSLSVFAPFILLRYPNCTYIGVRLANVRLDTPQCISRCADATLARRHNKCCRADLRQCQFPAFSISDPRPPRPFAGRLIQAWLHVRPVSSDMTPECCFPFVAACSYRRQST